jgi:diadenosine tetraphosphate (Ap4A) HIT family hydrolase
MSKWTDPGQWAKMRSGAQCPICLAGAPRDIVADLEVSWVTASADSPMVGYACLVFKRHAIELHELTAPEGAAFMRDMQRLSLAVATTTSAVKLNYEIHGNTLPHLHMHFFPRYRGDAFENRPIDPRSVVQPVYGPGQFADFRRRLVAQLTTE